MSRFAKARPEVGYLRMGCYGNTGSGKTLTSLLFATSLGKTVIFDTEKSGSLYAPKDGVEQKFKLPSFDREETKDAGKIADYLWEAYNDGYACAVIDQLGHIWEHCQDATLAEERRNMTKAWTAYEMNGTVPFYLWKKIKAPWKKLMVAYNDVPMHIFITGRLTDVFEVTGANSVSKVDERMAGEKEVTYEPTLLFKMERHLKGVKATVEKDKTGFLQNRMFINPAPEILEPILDFLGKNDHVAIAQEIPEAPSPAEGGEQKKFIVNRTHPTIKMLFNFAKNKGYDEEVVLIALRSVAPEDLEKERRAVITGDFSLFDEYVEKGGKEGEVALEK